MSIPALIAISTIRVPELEEPVTRGRFIVDRGEDPKDARDCTPSLRVRFSVSSLATGGSSATCSLLTLVGTPSAHLDRPRLRALVMLGDPGVCADVHRLHRSIQCKHELLVQMRDMERRWSDWVTDARPGGIDNYQRRVVRRTAPVVRMPRAKWAHRGRCSIPHTPTNILQMVRSRRLKKPASHPATLYAPHQGSSCHVHTDTRDPAYQEYNDVGDEDRRDYDAYQRRSRRTTIEGGVCHNHVAESKASLEPLTRHFPGQHSAN
ncbi:hypothetical protein EDB83DRAFT_2429557 [Lactarius deliciosus]|nr:hypothetical protein EDB83DRAFT_2429557 [Lactarius deliciosus]